MKFGIDMFAAQNGLGHCAGRYVRHLVRQLTARFTEHEWFLYFHESLGGSDGWPQRAQIRRVAAIGSGMPNGQTALEQSEDGVDLWLATATLDPRGAYIPPSSSVGGVCLAGLLFDLAPALVPDRFLHRPAGVERYRRALLTLPRYDLLLTVSEATRRDCLSSFGIDERRIATIGLAATRRLSENSPWGGLPRPSGPKDGLGRPPHERRISPVPSFRTATQESPPLRDCAKSGLDPSLGIRGPFVLCLAGDDEDRSVAVLAAAIERLPAATACRFQFVIGCRLQEQRQAAWQAQFARQGFGDRLRFVAMESDVIGSALYRQCEALIDASPYEGSGLPLLQALQCGAAVIVDRGSWHADLAGDAALCANVDQPADLAAKLEELLNDSSLLNSLHVRAPLVAGRYSLEAVADRAMEALQKVAWASPTITHDGGQCPPYRAGAPNKNRPRPPLAFFSPLLPQRTGLADYSERLLAALKQHYWVDLYHDQDYLPQLSVASADFACRDYRLFERFSRATDYAGIVYQMANTHFCAYLYDMLLRHPGVVVLHDYALPEFHFGYALRAGAPASFIADEIAFESAELADEYRRSAEAWRSEPGGVIQACIRRGLAFNRRVLEAAAVVVVHDRWGAEQIADAYPHLGRRVRVIPHGASRYLLSADEKRALRQRFGFGQDDLILSCFGLLNGAKYHGEAIEALSALAHDFPSARLIFVGGDLNDGREQAKAAELGVSDRVRFFGHAPMESFLELVSITDLAMNLRRPPTRGETSGALLTLLSAGVPTLVTDVDAFASYPDAVVRKIASLAPGDRLLEHALRGLLNDPQRRGELGRAAMQYVDEIHNWQRVASLYADAIDETRDLLGKRAA